MNRKLSLIVCNFIVPEFAEILHNGDYSDVRLLSFPASCNAVSKNTGSIATLLQKIDSKESDIVILNSNCSKLDKSMLDQYQPTVVNLQQCFEPFLNSSLLFYYISKGFYLATNGWLRLFDQHVKEWGFDNGTAGIYFNEALKKILFLDTKIPGDYSPNLQAMSEYMQLPYEIIPVGLENAKAYVDVIVSNWRYEKERRILNSRIARVTRQSADNMVILSQIEKFVNNRIEDDIIQDGYQMIDLLFAPQTVKYQRFGDQITKDISKMDADTPIGYDERSSFFIPINIDGNVVGRFSVLDVKFPEYLKQYRNMGQTISQIMSISISNARQYDTILEQSDRIADYSDELLRSNATKDKFFSIIAHDLRGPIGAASGLSELLMDEVKHLQAESITKRVSLLNKSLVEVNNLLNNLLEWARTQQDTITFNPQTFFLYEIVKEVGSFLSLQAGKKEIFIHMDFSEKIMVRADKALLTTIFRNLISNAIKFSHDGGEVKVTAIEKNNKVEIAVQDNGTGMADDVAGVLFNLEANKVRRGTSGEKGTGLGLILVKEFVEMHGSEIVVKSKVGEGSTFSFVLPSGNRIL